MSSEETIKDKWHYQELGTICSVKGGKRIPKGKSLQIEDNGKPYIRVSNMDAYGVQRDGMLYVPDEVAPTIQRYRVCMGDLYISVAGTLGLIGKIPKELDGAYLTENADRLTSIAIETDFLLHVLRGPEIQKAIDAVATRNAQPKLAIDKIKTFRIPTPSRSEQKKIAEILGLWDKAIALVERLIRERTSYHCGLAHNILTGRIRLSKFQSESPSITKLSKIPQGWTRVPFHEVFQRIVRKNQNGCDLALTISGRDGLVKQEEYFKKRVASAELSGYYLLKNGEFAFNRSTMKGYPYGAIKRLDRYPEGVVSTLYLCFGLSRLDCCSNYYKHYFESGLFNSEIYTIAQEGARSHGLLNIGTDDFFQLRILRPPEAEQKEISRILEASVLLIDKLSQLLNVLVRQKLGLMEQLLTGKKRVKV